MGKVRVEKLEVKTCHGVNDFEKKEPQRFEFFAEVGCDFYGAAKSDDVSQTVNYSSVCKIITAVATENIFNLIETLCWRCCEEILENFPQAVYAKVRVEKPQAPLKVLFGTVSAETCLKREKVYLSLGSSMGDKKAYLDFAVRSLSATKGISVRKVSSYLETAPYGGVAKNSFLNACAEIETYLPPRVLLREIHRIEAEGNRIRDVRWDDRTLDIDIIFYGRQIICDVELVVPHADYHNRAFVLGPLAEIAPDFVCPLFNRRIKQMYLEINK